MRLATYSRELTDAGVDAKTAMAHAKALETMLDDKYVTRDYLDAKLAEHTTKLYQALLVQTVGIAGLLIAILKLAH